MVITMVNLHQFKKAYSQLSKCVEKTSITFVTIQIFPQRIRSIIQVITSIILSLILITELPRSVNTHFVTLLIIFYLEKQLEFFHHVVM